MSITRLLSIFHLVITASLLVCPVVTYGQSQEHDGWIELVDKRTPLLATQAILTGPSLRINPATNVAAYWKGPEDRATWQIYVAQPSELDVLMVYGVPANLAGQSVAIELDGKGVLNAKLPNTGGWETFRQQVIGKISLPAGKHRLTVRPLETVRGDDLADIREIILVPHDPQRPAFSQALAPAQKEMLEHIQVPEGFIIEQVAGPPLVNRPISADFDEQGRLYVTESSGTNDNVQIQLAELPHRIVRLEDKNGDGIFDQRTVFADRMMLPQGALWHDGSLYVAAPPHIWKVTDINDDGVADKREVWFDGKTLGRCANDLHGPFLGPDGWLYWCKGAFQKQTYERPGQTPLVTRAAHILRRHPRGGPVEIVMTGGMNNPVDVVFTPGGERIFSTTFLQLPAGGKRDGLIHAVYGGVYPRENGVVDSHWRTGDLMPILTHMGVAAPCGLVRLETDQLGEGFRDSLLACQFNTHQVSHHVLAPNGATFIAQDKEFLKSDHIDFHPTDVLEDADGSVLVVNTGGWYMLCCPTSRLHKPDVLGAIYRVRRVNAKSIDDPRGQLIDWSALEPGLFVKRLADHRPAVRRRALERLVSLDKDAIATLTDAVDASPNPDVRRQAIWALTRIDNVQARAGVRAALADLDEQVRQAAAHSVSIWRDRLATDQLSELLTNDSLHNRRVAAEAMGRIGNRNAIDNLLTAAGDYRGRVLDHSIVYGLIEIGDAERIRGGLSAESTHVRRAAMLALENLANGQLHPETVVGLLDSAESQMAHTAWWITQRHPEWAGAMVNFFRNRILDPNADSKTVASLVQQLARFSDSPAIQQLMADGLRNSNVTRPTKLAILDGMNTSLVKTVPEVWWTELGRLTTDEDAKLVAGAVSVIYAHSPSPLTAKLKHVAGNSHLSMETRLRSLACITRGGELDNGLMALLAEELNASQPIRNRSLAVDVLFNANLADDQLVFLAQKLAGTAAMDLVRLVRVFGNSTSEFVGEAFVAGLIATPSATAIDRQELVRILSRYKSSVREEAGPLLKRIEAASAEKAAKFGAVLEMLSQGDVRRGQDVFFGTKASCSSCHSIGYRGGGIGPDLTNIGRIRDERSLLEAILYPSSSFVMAYEPTLIMTDDGRVYTGIVKEERNDYVVLALDAEKKVRIHLDEIEQRQAATVSVMPAGLEKQLSFQELADLVVFLKSSK